MRSTRCVLMVVVLIPTPTIGDSQAKNFESLCIIEDKRIDESSGLAVSHTCPHAVWIHNDSGDKPRLFLVGLDGRTKAVVRVVDAKAVDWEDMCSFEADGESWLLIGDIGDNDRDRGDERPACRLYLLKEPKVAETAEMEKLSCPVFATIRLKYEDGPWNCEGLAVDTERREILLLTKTAPQKCGLYTVPLILDDHKQKHTARRIGAPFIPFATALDISPEGRTMVVGSLLNGIIVRRSPGTSWTHAFASGGRLVVLPTRKQGETICFAESGRCLYANSEKQRQPLWRIRLPE